MTEKRDTPKMQYILRVVISKIFFSRKETNYIFSSVYYINYTAGRLFITDTKESYNYNLIEPLNIFLRKKQVR